MQTDDGNDDQAEKTRVWLISHTNRHFQKAMKSYREQKGWSQKTLSEQLASVGVKLDPSAVTRIETGAREPKHREATAIAILLDMPDHVGRNVNPQVDIATTCLAWVSEFERLRNKASEIGDLAERAQFPLNGLDNVFRLLPNFSFRTSYDGQSGGYTVSADVTEA